MRMRNTPNPARRFFFTQIQTDSVSSNHVETLPALGRSHSLDNSEMNRQSCTEPWRDKRGREVPSTSSRHATRRRLHRPFRDLTNRGMRADHPTGSIEEKSQPVDAASPMSEDSQPCDSSTPASAQSDRHRRLQSILTDELGRYAMGQPQIGILRRRDGTSRIRHPAAS